MDPAAVSALTQASEVSALIRRERSLKKLPFGVPVLTLRVPESVRATWMGVGGDVLAGNNASAAQITFGDDFTIEFAPPQKP